MEWLKTPLLHCVCNISFFFIIIVNALKFGGLLKQLALL